MPGHTQSFWLRLEMLVMAAACGTLLGTGLLAGVIRFGGGDVAAAPPSDNAPGAVFYDDGSGAYSARVMIDGVPLRMIVDTGTAHSSLSARDAQRLAQRRQSNVGNMYTAVTVDVAGQTLQGLTLKISRASSQSVIGLNLLSKLGPVTLAPGPHAD